MRVAEKKDRPNFAVILASAGTALAAASVLAACGSSTGAAGNAGNGASAAGTGTSAATAPGIQAATKNITAIEKPVQWPSVAQIANPPDLKGKSITLVPISAGIPVISAQATVEQTALEHLGAKVDICDGKFDPTAVASCINQATQHKDAAVMSLFVDYKMAPNAFDSAAASGVKVLIGGEPADGGKTSTPDLAFYDTSAVNVEVSGMASDAALADKGADANALIIKLTDSPLTSASSQAGVDEFTKQCPSCGVATVDFTSSNMDKLPSQVSAALVAHPKTNVVIVPEDSFVPLATQGIQSAGFASKVEVISTGGELAGMQRVAAGTQAHDVGIPAAHEGFALANALVQLLSGSVPASESQFVVRDFNKQNVGSLQLTTAAYVTPAWYGDASFEAQFYKAWGAN